MPNFIGFLLLSFICHILLQFFSKFSLISVTAIGSSRDTTRDDHTNWDKSERERQPSYHLNVQSKIRHTWTSLWNRKSLTDTENRLVVAKGGGEGRTGTWGWWGKRSRLEWINNQALLYSTRKHIQSPGINPNGKEHFIIYIYIYIYIYGVGEGGCNWVTLHLTEIGTTL